MAEHTIKAKYGLDTKEAKDALDDIKRHAERHGREAGGLGKLFALEPLGIRRGTHALEGLAEGFTNVAGEGRDALSAVTNFGRSLSLGIGAGLAIGVVGELAQKFLEARKEMLEFEGAIDHIRTSSLSSGQFQPLGEIKSNIGEASKAVDEIDSKLRNLKFDPTAQITAMMHGFKTVTEYRNYLLNERRDLTASIFRDIDKEAEKMRQLNSIEEARFRVSEHEARVQQEQIRHEEKLGELSAEDKQKGVVNKAARDKENAAHAQIMQREDEVYQATLRESAARIKASEITEKMAGKQREIANLQTLGLTKQQQSVATARAGVDVAGEKQQLAENELEAAQKQVDASRNLNEEEKARAQERLNRARAGVEGAKAGVTNAASAAASTEEGIQLEKGREEEMSPEEKRNQYNQRIKQREGLIRSFARQGLNTDLIDAPKYGESEYDPLARFRAAREQEMEQQEQQKLAQEKAQQQAQEQQQEQDKRASEEQSGLISRYAQGHDMTGVDPAKAAEIQRGIEASERQNQAIDETNKADVDREEMFSHSSARDKLPQDDSGLAHQGSKAPWVKSKDFQDRWPGTFPTPNTAQGIEQRADQLVRQKHIQPSEAKAQAEAEAAANKPISRADLEQVMQRYWGVSS